CDGQEGSRRLIAETQARAPQPDRAVLVDYDVIALRAVLGGWPESPLQVLDQLVGAAAAAGDVVAHVQDPARAWRHGEQRVEGGYPERIGRRHAETLADVIERPFADPSHPGLHRLESRKKQVAPIPAEARGEMASLALRA